MRIISDTRLEDRHWLPAANVITLSGVAGLPRPVQRWRPSVGHGDRPGAPRAGPQPRPHPAPQPRPPGGLERAGGGGPRPRPAPPRPPPHTTGRWPKRAAAPGKLRDPSHYWSIQHSLPSEGWPWPGVPAPAGPFPGEPGYPGPASWYSGPGGGDSSSPPACTNGKNNNGTASHGASSRTATPTTTAGRAETADWAEAAVSVSCAARLGQHWEWWPPDPPEEWALSNNVPWEPPPAPAPGSGPAPANGYNGLNGHESHGRANGHHEQRGSSSVWWEWWGPAAESH